MTVSPTPPSLEYAPPTAPRAVPVWLANAVLFCGLVPAIVGVCITAAYTLTNIHAFQLLGFVWLLAGGLIVLAGFGFALTYFCWPRRAPAKRGANLRAIVGVIILLLNFPIALGCMLSGEWTQERVTVIVYNDGATVLQNVSVRHGTRLVNIGPIPSGETRSGKLITNYGDVTTIIRRNDNDGSIQIVGHGDAGEIGSPMELHVDSAGKAILFMR